MRQKNLLFLLAVVLTCGLIAGCGDDSTTSTVIGDDLSTTESTTSDRLRRLERQIERQLEARDASSSDIDSEGVYNACVDAVSGTPGEALTEGLCVKGVVAKFEKCVTQAESLPNAARDDAIAICGDAADQGIKIIEAAG